MAAFEQFTLDTNILFYAVDRSDAEKHETAVKLVKAAMQARITLSLQTLNEFYFAATRKRIANPAAVVSFVDGCRATFRIVAPSEDDLVQAIAANQSHGLAYYDALLWATARRAGCRFLLTEDFQSGRMLDGVLFLNPFQDPPPLELQHFLA